LRPLDVHPTYDVAARLDRLPARLPGVSGWEALAGRANAAVELELKGTGYANASMALSGEARGPAGRVALGGRLRLGPGRDREWEIQRLAFDGLDIARLLGQDATSALSGSLSGRGGVGSNGALRAAAELRLDASTYGAVHLEHSHVRADANGAA